MTSGRFYFLGALYAAAASFCLEISFRKIRQDSIPVPLLSLITNLAPDPFVFHVLGLAEGLGHAREHPYAALRWRNRGAQWSPGWGSHAGRTSLSATADSTATGASKATRQDTRSLRALQRVRLHVGGFAEMGDLEWSPSTCVQLSLQVRQLCCT